MRLIGIEAVVPVIASSLRFGRVSAHLGHLKAVFKSADVYLNCTLEKGLRFVKEKICGTDSSIGNHTGYSAIVGKLFQSLRFISK